MNAHTCTDHGGSTEACPRCSLERRCDTPALWQRAHMALCHSQWGFARVLLEVLSLRDDVVDTLPGYSAYDRGDAGERAQFAQLIQDRIDAVNARVELNTAR